MKTKNHEQYLEQQLQVYLTNMKILQVYGDYIDRKKTSIDIGANRGELSWYLLKHCSKVIAFEPLPSAFSLLSNISTDRIKIYNLALSNISKQSILYEPYDKLLNGYNDGLSSLETSSLHLLNEKFPNRFDKSRQYNVELRRLDEFNFSNITSIKVDVEGHEIEVLDGARETILTNKPSLLVEIAWNKKGVTETIRYIEDFGYGCYYYDVSVNQLKSIKSISSPISEYYDFLFLPN